MTPAQRGTAIEMPLGLQTPRGTKHIVLDGGQDAPTPGKRTFEGDNRRIAGHTQIYPAVDILNVTLKGLQAMRPARRN